MFGSACLTHSRRKGKTALIAVRAVRVVRAVRSVRVDGRCETHPCLSLTKGSGENGENGEKASKVR